jgi:tRNA nucleotidyltransferase/poly(A) polymerase
MNALTPRQPRRPLIWPDEILELQDFILMIEQPVYIVGGAVRDAYLHRPVKDLDLATPGSAIKLARQLANALKAAVFVLDEERDVARILLRSLVIDVAAFRAGSLLEDLRDRDFTLNAMAVDFKGDLSLLIDPLDGESDIAAKQLRRCSPEAIYRDVIRALRAVRQSLQFGFRIEPETLQDLRANAPRLKETSGERIRDDLMKLLQLPKVSGALRVADKVGLLTVIVPEVAALHTTAPHDSPISSNWEHTLLVIDKLNLLLQTISFNRTDATAATFEMGMIVMAFDRYRSQLNEHIATRWSDDRPHIALLMLAALLHETGAAVMERAAEELRLSNAEKQRLILIIKHQGHSVFNETVTPLAAHRFWHSLGAAGIDVILLTLANYLGRKAHTLEQDPWLMLVERAGALLEAYYLRYNEIVAPPVLVDGNQLKALFDLKPSPIIGELLTIIREGQAEGRLTTVDEALEAARTYLQRAK